MSSSRVKKPWVSHIWAGKILKEKCVSGGHIKGSKDCDCRAEMQTGEIKKDVAGVLEGASSLIEFPALTLRDGKQESEAIKPVHYRHHARKDTQEFFAKSETFQRFFDEFNIVSHTPFDHQYTHSRGYDSFIPADVFANVNEWLSGLHKQPSRPDHRRDLAAILESAWKIQRYNNTQKWLTNRPDHRSLRGFLERFASYDTETLVGKPYTDRNGIKQIISFGGIGLPRLGSKEWIAIRSDERDLNGNVHTEFVEVPEILRLRWDKEKENFVPCPSFVRLAKDRSQHENLERHNAERLSAVAQAIRDNPELYRAQLQLVRTPVHQKSPCDCPYHNTNGTFRQGRAYRDLIQPKRLHVWKRSNWKTDDRGTYKTVHDFVLKSFGLSEQREPNPLDLEPLKRTVKYNLVQSDFQCDNKAKTKDLWKVSNSIQSINTESLSALLPVEPYKQPKDGFGKTFFDAGSSSASLQQEANGVWRLIKAYRGKDGKPKTIPLYIGVAKDQQGRELIRRESSPEAKKQQALKYCTKQSVLAFRRRDWEQWLQWLTRRAALIEAGAKGRYDAGGWSSIFTGNSADVLDTRSRQAPEIEADRAQKSTRRTVLDYLGDDYNDQERNAALLKAQDALTFTTDETGEGEVAIAQEVSTAHDLLREEPKEETEERKASPKKPNTKDGYLADDWNVYRAVLRKGLPWLASQRLPRNGSGKILAPLTEYTRVEERLLSTEPSAPKVLCSSCGTLQLSTDYTRGKFTLACGHERRKEKTHGEN